MNLEEMLLKNKIGDALSLLEESFKKGEENKDPLLMFESGRRIAEYLAFLGEVNGAVKYFKKIEKLSYFLNTPNIRSKIAELKIKLLREGIVHIDVSYETILIEESLKDAEGDSLARFLYALMVLKMMIGKNEEAEGIYKDAVNIEDVSEEVLWYINREYGLLLLLNKQPEKAIQHYSRMRHFALNIIEKIKIYTELYRLTKDEDYHEEAKKYILTLMLNLPFSLKKTFLNKPSIKKVLMG